MLGLRFCVRAFSSCGERGPLFIAVCGLLTVAASLVAEHKPQTRRLSSCGSRPSCSAACGILPDQGSNPCPLHWQADSQPLRHQGSPTLSSFGYCSYIMSCEARWTNSSLLFFLKILGTSLVAQWLRICLPMQGTWVLALVQEDPTCHGTTKPVHHNY